MPEPALSPGDVIRIQLEALRHNDEQDRGIAVAFRFASPSNRANTGPLSRFITMIKEGPYALMLDFRDATYGPVEAISGRARQRVTLTGCARKHDLLVLSVPAVGGALRGLLDDGCGVHRAVHGSGRIAVRRCTPESGWTTVHPSEKCRLSGRKTRRRDVFDAIRKEIAEEYAQPHEKPWIVGFSGGKDSTLVAHLVA